MDIHISTVNGTSRVIVHGELDIATTVLLRRALAEEIDHGRRVELDLGGVTFMDTTGARMLAWLLTLVRDSAVRAVVTAASPATHRLLHAANAEHLLLGLQMPRTRGAERPSTLVDQRA